MSNIPDQACGSHNRTCHPCGDGTWNSAFTRTKHAIDCQTSIGRLVGHCIH